MRKLAFLLLLMPALLLGPVSADVLLDPHGAKVEGTLEEVTLRVHGVPSPFPGDLIERIDLGEGGSDALVLSSGAKAEGQVISVRFKSSDGILTVNRNNIGSITLKEASAEAAAPAKEGTAVEGAVEEAMANEDEKAVEEDDLSVEDLERREKLGANLALARAAFAKADTMREEDVDKLKDKYLDDAEKVVRELDSLEKSIRSKIKRRRDAQRRWNYYRKEYGSDYTRRHSPPDFSTDGLDKDKRDYKNAQKRKRELKDKIGEAIEKIDQRRALRKRRVRIAYEMHKKLILEGQEPAEEQMKEKYFRALDLQSMGQEAKQKAKAAGILKGERKPNPFDEMFDKKDKK
jgi:hypothetical protein